MKGYGYFFFLKLYSLNLAVWSLIKKSNSKVHKFCMSLLFMQSNLEAVLQLFVFFNFQIPSSRCTCLR